MAQTVQSRQASPSPQHETASARNRTKGWDIARGLDSWRSASNSNPVEGLEVALRRYVNPKQKVSNYIFGDDYIGGSYDPVIDTVTKLNKNRVSGKQMAKIHAIVFLYAFNKSLPYSDARSYSDEWRYGRPSGEDSRRLRRRFIRRSPAYPEFAEARPPAWTSVPGTPKLKY